MLQQGARRANSHSLSLIDGVVACSCEVFVHRFDFLAWQTRYLDIVYYPVHFGGRQTKSLKIPAQQHGEIAEDNLHLDCRLQRNQLHDSSTTLSGEATTEWRAIVYWEIPLI